MLVGMTGMMDGWWNSQHLLGAADTPTMIRRGGDARRKLELRSGRRKRRPKSREEEEEEEVNRKEKEIINK